MNKKEYEALCKYHYMELVDLNLKHQKEKLEFIENLISEGWERFITGDNKHVNVYIISPLFKKELNKAEDNWESLMKDFSLREEFINVNTLRV